KIDTSRYSLHDGVVDPVEMSERVG
ncbi:MAG: hypothetical protein ACI9PZ_001950, partial [Parvicella sp.]